jgi:hypothetical protein
VSVGWGGGEGGAHIEQSLVPRYCIQAVRLSTFFRVLHTVRKDLEPYEHCLYWTGISSLLRAEKIFVLRHFWCEDVNRHP